MLHYVRTVDPAKDLLGYNLSEDPQTFTALIKLIKKNGFQTIHASDLLNGKKLPDKPVLITFDDGYEDFFTQAKPILEANGFTASEAIISGDMAGDPNGQTYMSPEQVKQIDQAGFEIFSHTVNHKDLSTLSTTQQQKELQSSKEALEKLLGHPIVGVVYPSGKYNSDTLDIAKTLGYQIAFTTKPGYASSDLNLLELPRIRVDNRDSIQSVLNKLLALQK